jgi:hypothetical protein
MYSVMPETQTQFESLGQEFERLSRSVGECRDPERRRQLLRQMKVILDEITQLAMDLPQVNSQPLNSKSDSE